MKPNLEGISPKALTENLRSLEADGILTRQAHADTPTRAEYTLSELGVSMRPILHAMEQWGLAYLDQHPHRQ